MNPGNLFSCTSFFDITRFGAAPDGKTLCTAAIYKAVEACEAFGGGTVYIPAGRFLTGPIELKSNIILFLASGAYLLFSMDKELYPVVESRWEGAECPVFMPMIYGRSIHNVTVSGYGILDGQGDFWWDSFKNKDLSFPRPRLLCFEDCSHVRIENIECRNSPSWTINPVRSSNVTITGVSIINPPDSPNTDGINPDSSRNVHISNCHVDVGDDCITLKAGTEKSSFLVSCENITITNCTLVHGHGGVVIGSEMSGDVRNVVISNIIFQGTDRGIRIKTRRGRGGVVENIRISNCIMEDVMCPFVINEFYYCGDGGKSKMVGDKGSYPVGRNTPQIRGIHFSQITAKNAHYTAAFLYGLPEMPLSDISFSDIRVMLCKEAKSGLPAMMDGIEPVTKRGFILNNVDNISFNNISVSGCEGPLFDIQNAGSVNFTSCIPGIVNDKVLLLQGCENIYFNGIKSD